MAKLAISGLGAGIGGYFGGQTGSQIGWGIGSIIGNLLFPEPPTQVGPRITERAVTSTAFGEPIIDGWGTINYPGHLIDSSDLIESKHKATTPGGKGFGGPAGFSYQYSVDAAWIFRRREAAGFLRVWFDTKLIRNVGEDVSVAEVIASNFEWKGGALQFYSGAETQLPDPRLEALHGVGNVPAYRGMVYIVAGSLALADFGNRVPTMTAEIFDTGTDGWTLADVPAYELPLPPAVVNSFGAVWGNVSDQGEIIMYKSGAVPFGSQYNDAINYVYRITPDGVFNDIKLPVVDFSVRLIFCRSDVPGYCLTDATFNGRWIFFDYLMAAVYEFIRPPTGYTNTKTLFANYCFYVYDIPNDTMLAYDGLGGLPRYSAVLGTTGDLNAWCATVNYIWAISTTGTGTNPHAVYKIDPASLTIIDTYTPEIGDFATGFQEPNGGITAVSDTEIYISTISANEGPIRFYRYDPSTDTTTFLGTAELTLDGITTLNVAAGFELQSIYSNGVFYFGQQSLTSGYHAVYRFVPTGVGDGVLLSKIVSDCCKFAGVSASRIDVTELTDTVWGYARDAQTTPADMIRALMNGYFFDACESDGKIKFKKRGRAVSYTIDKGDVAAHEPGEKMPDKVPARQIQERQLPTQLRVKYIQKDHDYEKGMQSEERIITDFRNIVEVDVPVSLSDDEARQIAGKIMPIAWAERNTREIRLSRKYIKLEVADAFEVTV